MSLVSWFKEASFKKKAAVAALAAVNALTMVNSGIIGHRITFEGLSRAGGSSPALDILIAPVMTGGQWYYSRESSQAPVGETPVSLLANQTKKILPQSVDTAVGVAFAVAGAPGSWVGQTIGVITGISARVKYDLSH